MQQRWLRASILVVCFAAAATAGYWVSAELGAEALRQEAQDQLSTVMKGSVRIARARLVIRGGLFIEGERVGVYPRSTVPRRPALFASRVSAELDVLALLTGRFRLNGLLLDDAVLEVHRSPAGEWSPPPLQSLADRGSHRPSTGAGMERSLDWIHAFEAVTRALLQAPVVARRVELRRSRITLFDEATDDAGRPVELGFYRVDGRLVHHWLSGDADLELRASLVGPGRTPVPLKVEGWQRGGDEMRLAISADRLGLSYLAPYLAPLDDRVRIDGAWSGEIAYETQAKAHGILTVQSEISGFSAAMPVRNGRFEMVRPHVELAAALEVHPGRVRLADGHFDTEGMAISLTGSVERPLGPASRARLEIGVGGLDLDAVRAIVRSLPEADSETLETVLVRVDDGRIERIGARGTARIDEWGPLLVGEAERLPRGFVLSASVADVRVRAGETGRLSGMGGVIEVSGDRLTLRDATGLWNDEPLPRLAVSIQGVSHLFRGQDPVGGLTANAGALPGLGPLLAVLRGERDEAAAPPTPPRIRLDVDRLEHPILRWPVTDTHVAIETGSASTRLDFTRGSWAGAPFEGDAVWMKGDPAELVVSIRVRARTEPHPATASSAHAEATLPWAVGRFDIDELARERLPIDAMHGGFAITGTTLALHDVELALAPTGSARATLALALDHPEQVGLALDFDLSDGDVGRLGPVLGLPTGLATGRIGATGHLEGPIRPQTPLLTSLVGSLEMDAREGEVRRDELPLVLALAQASSGYNDYAARDAIAYDSIRASFGIDRGRVSTQDFELDGPLRVYASGSIDTIDPPHEIVAVVGLFLFRSAGQIMETIPLVKAFLPGSERGLMGAYFQITGPFEDPHVKALAGRSVEEDLPDVITAPYKLLRSLFGGGRSRRATPPPDADAGDGAASAPAERAP